MTVTSARGPLTSFLVLLFVLVLARWLEMRLGWGEYLVLPLGALAGVGLFEATAPAGSRRLTGVEWMLNALAAVALAALIYLVAR